jgi:hypothetical protein
MAAKKRNKRTKATEADPLGFRKHRARTVWRRWHTGDTIKALAHDYGLDPSTVTRDLIRAYVDMDCPWPVNSKRAERRFLNRVRYHRPNAGF